jgi:hypothetical protein
MTTDFSYVGLAGLVVLAIPEGGLGEVEVHTERGAEILFARTAPDRAIPVGAHVLIVDYHGGRHADVAEWDPLRQLVPEISQPGGHIGPPPMTQADDEVYNVLDLDQPRDTDREV